MTVANRRTAGGVVPALLAVRLEIEDAKITQAEHLVADVPPEADLARLQTPRPGLVAPVPERDRMPRGEIAAIAASYYFAVDPVQGLATGLSHFRQSMSRGAQLMIAADGTEVMWEEKRDPYDLPAAHVFKIAAGEIHEVEAVGIFVPYGSPSGWE